MKKLIVFDLDGTLAESKSSLDAEMAGLLRDLLSIVRVAIISGGNWPQFDKQLLSNLPHDDRLKNLSLLPTCGTKFFRYDGTWRELYSEDFTAEEKEKLFLPYFSTKGRGTGLGLAIVSHILAEHNANIRVEDNKPCGAWFQVEIPVAVVDKQPAPVTTGALA